MLSNNVLLIEPVYLSFRFNGHFPGEREPGLPGFIGAKEVVVMQSSSQIFTTNKPTPNFLQAGCPSCRPSSTVLSKH